jgi:hypothetical protein
MPKRLIMLCEMGNSGLLPKASAKMETTDCNLQRTLLLAVMGNNTAVKLGYSDDSPLRQNSGNLALEFKRFDVIKVYEPDASWTVSTVIRNVSTELEIREIAFNEELMHL